MCIHIHSVTSFIRRQRESLPMPCMLPGRLCHKHEVCAAQPSFISTFGLSMTDLPTLVAFHPKKLRGASLRASFSAESIDALLDGLFSGSIHSEAFQELPALVEGGEDDSADLDPIEEEFDLADVLGEDVGGSGSKEELLRQAEMQLEVCTSVAHAQHAV